MASADSPHLRQMGRSLPVAELPPADGAGWGPAAAAGRGRVVVSQSLASGDPGYAWGVEVETSDGALVLLQPLPMQTRAVGLQLPAGDYTIATHRQVCVDGCARVGAPVRHCRTDVHVESEAIVELGESAPDRSCRLLHQPAALRPGLASIGVRHVGAGGWQFDVGGVSVALAPPIDALSLWVDAGRHELGTWSRGDVEGAACSSIVEATLGDAIEVVHTVDARGCRPYRTDAPPVSHVTLGDR